MRKPSPISISSPRDTSTSRPSASAARARGSSAVRASSSTEGRSRRRTGTSLEAVDRFAPRADDCPMDATASPLGLARHDLDRDRPDRALAALSKVTGDELETYEFWW